MSAVEFEIDFKRLQRKLAGLEKYAPRNAMKAAAGAAFKVVNKENARRVATADLVPFRVGVHDHGDPLWAAWLLEGLLKLWANNGWVLAAFVWCHAGGLL